MKHPKKSHIIYLFSVILFLALWELISGIINQPFVLPTFQQVLKRLVVLLGEKRFILSVWASLGRVFLAFVFTFLLGTLLGVLSGLFKNFQVFLSFPLSLIRSTPMVALIMLVLFWFPSDSLPVFCAVLMGLPVLVDGVSKAVQNTDPKLLEMSRVFHFSAWSTISGIYLPCTLPYIKGSLRTVFSMSWKVVAAGEILALPGRGLGALLQNNRILLETDAVFALVLVLTLLGILSEFILFRFFHLLGVTFTRLWRLQVGTYAAPASASVPCGNPQGPASPPDAAVEIQNLTFSYDDKQIFNDFSLKLEPYSITAITGPSGQGKTTLLNILAGLIPSSAYTGTVSCPEVSYIFQDSRLVPEICVLRNLALPLFSRMSRKEAYKKSFEILKNAGFLEFAFTKTDHLSGGERQKFGALRALLTNTPVLLMDEGTSSLDLKSQGDLWKIISATLAETPRTFIFVTHNKEESLKYAHRIVNI